MTDHRLPNFIGVGAPRCGTTWLYNQLSLHPEVFMSEIKELSFFLPNNYRSNYSRGLEWYKSNFPDQKERHAYGEISPRYYFTPGSAEAIKQTIPDVKLIFFFRNPAEMVRSLAYFHAGMYASALDPSLYGLNDFLHHHFIEPLVRFGEHLEHYLRCFQEDQILTIFHEDISKEPARVLQSVQRFLELEQEFNGSQLQKRVNKGTMAKLFRFSNWTRHYQGIGKYRLKAFETRLNRTDQMHEANYAYSREMFDQLLDVYKMDTTKLSALTNRNLDHWHSFENLPSYMRTS